jgi:hypothetical protein
MDLRTGDILHCKSKGLISFLISFFTKSDITHTALFISVWGEPFIIDAQKDGVNLRPFDEWLKKYNYTYIVSRPIGIEEKSLAFKAMKKLGITGYDYVSLLLKYPIHFIFKKWLKNSEQKMYCSEYVAWVLDIENYERLSPVDLYDYCKNNILKFETYENVTSL